MLPGVQQVIQELRGDPVAADPAATDLAPNAAAAVQPRELGELGELFPVSLSQVHWTGP